MCLLAFKLVKVNACLETMVDVTRRVLPTRSVSLPTLPNDVLVFIDAKDCHDGTVKMCNTLCERRKHFHFIVKEWFCDLKAGDVHPRKYRNMTTKNSQRSFRRAVSN
jgi:hypothetical protein